MAWPSAGRPSKLVRPYSILQEVLIGFDSRGRLCSTALPGAAKTSIRYRYQSERAESLRGTPAFEGPSKRTNEPERTACPLGLAGAGEVAEREAARQASRLALRCTAPYCITATLCEWLAAALSRRSGHAASGGAHGLVPRVCGCGPSWSRRGPWQKRGDQGPSVFLTRHLSLRIWSRPVLTSLGSRGVGSEPEEGGEG